MTKATSSKTAKNPTKAKQAATPKPLSSTQLLEAFGLDPLLEMIANGLYYEDIAKKAGVSRNSMIRWLNEHHLDVYTGAREARADKLFEDILKIADDGSNDTYLDDEGFSKTDQDVIARSRLRVDTRKWMAAKMLPKKYGDKLELSGDANSPLVVVKDFSGTK